MARQLHLTPPPISTSQTGLAAVSFLFCAFALFMCASHTRKKLGRSFKAACIEFIEEEPVIEHQNDTFMYATTEECQNYQVVQQSHESIVVSCEQEQQQGAIWQKNILMGGKCQLPDFSGVIIYDTEGNVVTPAKAMPPLLTWK